MKHHWQLICMYFIYLHYLYPFVKKTWFCLSLVMVRTPHCSPILYLLYLVLNSILKLERQRQGNSKWELWTIMHKSIFPTFYLVTSGLNSAIINYKPAFYLHICICFGQSCEWNNGKFCRPAQVQGCVFRGVVVQKRVCACAYPPPPHPPSPPLTKKDTGLRHHSEDKSSITAREKSPIKKTFPRSSARKASWFTAVVTRWCCKGMLEPCSAGFRDEEEGMGKAEGHSRQGHPHNSRARRLMVTINVAPEKRGYYKCCGGELCFSLYKLEVQGSNPLHSLIGQMSPTPQAAPVAFICSQRPK